MLPKFCRNVAGILCRKSEVQKMKIKKKNEYDTKRNFLIKIFYRSRKYVCVPHPQLAGIRRILCMKLEENWDEKLISIQEKYRKKEDEEVLRKIT